MMVEPPPAPTDYVDSARLMATCAVMAERVKLSGTGDELASLATIRQQLDAFGFHTATVMHDAYISLPGAARVEVDDRAVTAITHSFSLSSPEAGLTGRLVRWDDTDAGDLAGCIALVDGIASPAAADRLRRAGAVGQLHISPHDHLHEMCISPVWGNPGLSTRPALPTTVACTVSLTEGTMLLDQLRRGEQPVVTLHAQVDTGWRQTPILVADLEPAATPGAPFVLLSGHHDTWYFGVMDNGAANATMLECARVLALDRASWRRGLRLCFWSGHSHGRYSGSAWYVDNHWAELDRRCAAHVNVDSTGGIGATVMTNAGAAAELTPLAAAAIRQEMGLETGQVHAGKRLARNSDNSFWGLGVPTMFGCLSLQPDTGPAMRNALGWWWHTPEDLLDKIDPAHLVRDTRVFVAALWRLLTDPVLPFDYAAHATALLQEVYAIGATLGGALDLTPLITAASMVRDRAASLQSDDPARADRSLMGASRALVPLDYTAGDRFAHDPALPQTPWPVLDPIRALARASPADRPFAAVDAVRARNRVLHALQEAVQALT